MRSTARPLIDHRLALLAGTGALALWAIVLAQALPRLMAFGPICGGSDHAWLVGHCPLCFAAAALTALALGGLIKAQASSPRRIPIA